MDINNIKALGKLAFPLFFIAGLSLLLAFIIKQTSFQISLFIVVSIFIFILSFVKTEYAIYFLLFSMLLSPEIIVGAAGSGASLETRRQLVLRFEDLILLIIGLSWFTKTAIHKELGLILKTPLNKPIAIYILTCAFPTFWGALFGRVELISGLLYLIKYIEYFVIYFVIVNYVDNEKLAKRLITVAIITSILIAILAIYQIPGGERVTAPFEGERGEPNTLGGYLLFMIALGFGLFLNLTGLWNKLIWGGYCLILFIPFLFTLSRSSWLAAVPMVLTFIILSRKRLYISILLLLIIAFLLIFSTELIVERITYTFNPPYHPDQISIGETRIDTSASARLASWKRGLIAWAKHPLFGYGITGYSFMDAQYVRVLVETGIVGFFAFLLLLYSVYKATWNVQKQMKKSFYKGLSMGYLAGFIALCAHSIGANTFIIIRIMEPFWFFTAIIIILPYIASKKSEANESSNQKEVIQS